MNNETNVQMPSKMINGMYFNKIEAVQASPAPIKLSKINDRSVFFNLPVAFKK